MTRVLIAALLTLLAAACAPQPATVQKGSDAAHYFRLGEEAFESHRYTEAIEAWEKVRESYFSPELNTLAELKIAEAHFAAEEYLEATAAYEEFLKQHPNYEKTPQVLFQLGLAYDRQILSPDRDQTAARNAISTFESLLRRYPSAPDAAQAEAMIAKARQVLAEHELYVGRFYYRTGRGVAAINRLAAIPESYPGFAHLDEVYFLLGRSYLDIGDDAKAREIFATLAQRYPDSKFTDKTRGLLD